MSYDVYLTESFQNSLKSLKKKYRRIKDDIVEIIRNLENDPSIGEPIPGWNSEIWKIRAASSDMKRGKSGGYRIIYLWRNNEQNVYLLTIYFKGEKEVISFKDIGILLGKADL